MRTWTNSIGVTISLTVVVDCTGNYYSPDRSIKGESFPKPIRRHEVVNKQFGL